MNEAEAQKALDELASRALLIDIEGRRNRYYVLPPPMAGFFEFSLMRLRGDVDQKLLAQLYYQYITVEEDFIKALFTRGETQLGRTFVNEEVLSNENALHVLDYERASEVVKTASPPGHRPLLLPAQDGARRPRLRRPARHLHDLQHDGRVRSSGTATPGRSTSPRGWPCSKRPATATSSSSGRTSGPGSASSAIAAAAAARP